MDNQHISAPPRTSINLAEPLYGAAADEIRDQLAEPSDLAVAISVGQRMLAAYDGVGCGDIDGLSRAHGALTESLRILLRALGAEPSVSDGTDDEQAAVRRSVDAQFPAVAAFLATERGEGQ